MPYAVTCKACGARFSVGDELYKRRVAGKFVTVNCKSCRAAIRLEGNETPTRRGSTRPPSATRQFPSRPPVPQGPARPAAPSRLPSMQRTQLGGLTARAPSAVPRPGGAPALPPAPAANAAASVKATPAAVKAGPSPPRPRIGNLPLLTPNAAHQLADAVPDSEEATLPFGAFFDMSDEIESVPPSAGPPSLDLTDEVEAVPPSMPLTSVPLAEQLARSRVPHPPKKDPSRPTDPGPEQNPDDPIKNVPKPPELTPTPARSGATIQGLPMPKAPAIAAHGIVPATKSPIPATRTPIPAAAASPQPRIQGPPTKAPAPPTRSPAPAAVAEASLVPSAPAAERMQLGPPALALPSTRPAAPARKSGSAMAVIGLLVLLLVAGGAYRFLKPSASEPREPAAPPAEIPAAEAPPKTDSELPVEAAPPAAPTPEPMQPAAPAAEPPRQDPAAPPEPADPLPPARAITPAPRPRADAAPSPAPAPAPKPAQPAPADVKPSTPRPPKPTGPVGPFDRAAAAAALSTAAAQASACKKPGDPSGTASVTITFAPSGRVTSANLSGPPFAGTATGSCIAGALRRATVPPFEGDRITVAKTVVIR